MAQIGLPEILLALLIAAVLWACRGFPIPENRIVRYALLVMLAVLCGVLLNNWTTTFRPIAD